MSAVVNFVRKEYTVLYKKQPFLKVHPQKTLVLDLQSAFLLCRVLSSQLNRCDEETEAKLCLTSKGQVFMQKKHTAKN